MVSSVTLTRAFFAGLLIGGSVVGVLITWYWWGIVRRWEKIAAKMLLDFQRLAPGFRETDIGRD